MGWCALELLWVGSDLGLVNAGSFCLPWKKEVRLGRVKGVRDPCGAMGRTPQRKGLSSGFYRVRVFPACRTTLLRISRKECCIILCFTRRTSHATLRAIPP